MPLPIASGNSISMLQIATEFGDTRPFSLSEFYRGGSLVPASNLNVPTGGAISMGSFYGAAAGPVGPVRSSFEYIFNVDSNDNDLFTLISSSPLYVANNTDVIFNIPSARTLGASTPASFAVSVPNSFGPNDTVTIINNGQLVGKGGNGGGGSSPAAGGPGVNGGPAIIVSRPTTITNGPLGVIAGGGGGGGGGTGYSFPAGKTGTNFVPGGGGGGGGGVVPGTGGTNGNGTTTSSNGTATTGGAGAQPGTTGPSGLAGWGGSGGNLGSVGVRGGGPGTQPNTNGFPGGISGFAINALNPASPTPFATITNSGQILGPSI